MQCRQKYKRAAGDNAEQEQVNKTRIPSPSKVDAMLDFSQPTILTELWVMNFVPHARFNTVYGLPDTRPEIHTFLSKFWSF